MADISGKTWNEVKGGVITGINDFFNQELRNGGLSVGDAVVVDIAEAIMGMDIAGYCRFNDRMYTLMNRLMQININEKNIRHYSLGNNAHDLGQSDIFDSEIPKYRYAEDVNYLKTAESLRKEERVFISSTQGYENSYEHGQMYPNGFNYGNLYPDDIDGRLSGEAADKKWRTNNKDSILAKTRRLFGQGKINTIISRFGTGTDGPSNKLKYNGRKGTEKYGESHGRNLLTASSEKKGVSQYTFNGYNNPYCRVWTHHYQYDKYFKTIRPFNYIDSNGNYDSTKGVREFHRWDGFQYERFNTKHEDKGLGYGWKNGDAGWEYSVLDTETKGGDGIVKIAPKYINGQKSNIHTKECMFSIENLAWRGYDPYSFEKALSWEQRGPLGGRIMWFPPYGITFNETTNVNWSSSTFIGRGEDVFTYVNSQRSGTLSFLMVVDHPSVIDYASWHDEQGDFRDTDMLRFFAGCDSLSPKDENSIMSIVKPTPLTDEYVQKYQEPVYDYPIVNTPPEKPTDPPKKIIKVKFAVYYPNNYSGLYDSADYAIGYLLCGKGAGKSDDGLNDIPYSFRSLKSWNESDDFGGYEMGIYAENRWEGPGLDGFSDGYSTQEEINDAVEELNNEGNFIYAFAQSYEKISKRSDKDRNKWFYRVDGEYSTKDANIKNTYGQRPLSPGGKRNTSVFDTNGNIYDTNYLDLRSYSYNCNDYTFVRTDDDGVLIGCSLSEIAYVIADIKGYEQSRDYLSKRHPNREIESDGKKSRLIDVLKSLFENYKLSGIEANGFSNSHGDNAKYNDKRNDVLAKNRAQTVVNWLSGEGYSVEKPDIGYSGGTKTYKSGDELKEVEKHQHSGGNAKYLRSADVTLSFSYDNTDELAKYEEEMATFQKYDKYNEAGTDEQGRKLYKHIDDGSIWFELSDGTLVRNDVGKEIGISNMRGRSQSQYLQYKGEGVDYGIDDGRSSGKRYYTDDAIRTYVRDGNLTYDAGAIGGGERNVWRYDQEYYFFKTLEKKNPLVFNKLMDKIKYFDPAFHSMTPEGFNARLTFLNQCTRQGNTISMSDINGQTANNLAFGRPPFCVLRIGDFYNQMIVIDNINIDYSVSEGVQWDLNTEGIGMQPLLAQVSISFKFIGGGDMAGPIRRLQNAMSFNYYANARYYDNRADRVVYESENNYTVIGGAGNHNIDIDNSGNYSYITNTYKKNKQFTDSELLDGAKGTERKNEG